MRRALSFVALMGLWADAAGACTVVNGPLSPKLLVARAAVIVVAIAVRPESQPPWPARGLIEFRVESVLRGNERLPGLGMPPILIEGTLTQRDDFNDRPAPYDFVRPAGRNGSCFAEEYREGGRFLLLLNRLPNGSLTPNWAALAPTNEQLRGPDDPWLTIVRKLASANPHR